MTNNLKNVQIENKYGYTDLYTENSNDYKFKLNKIITLAYKIADILKFKNVNTQIGISYVFFQDILQKLREILDSYSETMKGLFPQQINKFVEGISFNIMDLSNHTIKLRRQLVKLNVKLYEVIKDPILEYFIKTKGSVNIIKPIIRRCQSVINEVEEFLLDLEFEKQKKSKKNSN